MRYLRTMLAATALACASPAALAQSAQPPNSCDGAAYRAFDFWIGEWEVFTPDGKKAGDNIITKEEYGCVLVERWTNMGGVTGQSYNFYDPLSNKFRQVWVSAGAVIDYAGGLNDAGEMVMEGEIAYHNGTKAGFRGTWTPNDDGSVKQYFQQYNDETSVWDDWFTGIYKKKAMKADD